MTQNFNSHGASHGSPPSHQANGYEDLMGSLKSPGIVGPTNPFQQAGFASTQWPMQMGWQQTSSNGSFPFSMPSQLSPVNQISWTQNNQEGYVPFSHEEEDDDLFTVDDTDVTGESGQQQSNPNVSSSDKLQASEKIQTQGQTQARSLPSISSSSPLTLPPPQLQAATAPGPPAVPISPKANNTATTARAAELRAKLLASRGPKVASRQSSPAVKVSDSAVAKKAEPSSLIKQTNGETKLETEKPDTSAAVSTNTFSNQNTDNKASLQPSLTSPTHTATSLNGAIDTLMADARDAVDAPRIDTPPTNGDYTTAHHGGKPVQSGSTTAMKHGTIPHRPTSAMSRNRSISELSEPGEIRSGADTPTRAEYSEPPKLNENTRAMQESRDQEEKLARQNEVNQIYQPLKKARQQKPEAKGSQGRVPIPKQTHAQQQKPIRKASLDKGVGEYQQPAIREESRREEHRERARDYDRRDEHREFRRTSITEAYATPHDLERDVVARRQKMTDDNARRAAEYKRNLDAQRARPSNVDSYRPPKAAQTREMEIHKPPPAAAVDEGRRDMVMSDAPVNNEVQVADGQGIRQGVDSLMQSPGAQPIAGNEDINDWLEMTEYYDEEYREKRLELFRKKKALDVQREEIEREEQLQLQERSMRSRAQSLLHTGTPSPAARRSSTVNVRMPPPPLPLKQTNNDPGIKIKSSALSASLPASQASSPTLKRQHAEDDTETSRRPSVDKRPRLDVNNLQPDERTLTSPASAKGERAPPKGETVPLESRMSRYDDWAPPRGRPRSRSPDFRRRSLSPRRRRYSQEYSPGPAPGRFRDYSTGPRRPNDPRTCFNCGQPGHLNGQCPEPRRDGRDYQAAPRRYEQYKPSTFVSPNYLGKNPQPNPPKSRVNSVSKIEEV